MTTTRQGSRHPWVSPPSEVYVAVGAAFFAAGVTLDTATTLAALSIGLQEGNPVVRAAMEALGPATALLVTKAAAVPAVAAVARATAASTDLDQPATEQLFYVGCAVLGLVWLAAGLLNIGLIIETV